MFFVFLVFAKVNSHNLLYLVISLSMLSKNCETVLLSLLNPRLRRPQGVMRTASGRFATCRSCVTLKKCKRTVLRITCGRFSPYKKRLKFVQTVPQTHQEAASSILLQKGGVPATPSGTATLLRLSPNYRFCPRPFLAVADFRHPQLSWLDGRCVQGPGTYSPRHG